MSALSPKAYAARVRKLEAEGMTTSDAQGVIDAKIMGEVDKTPGVAAAMQEWCNRANAYPELVAALRDMVAIWEGPRERAALQFAAQVVKTRALLAKLGEDK